MIAVIVGAIPGATSFMKKYIANSTLFIELSSRIAGSFGSFRSTRRSRGERTGGPSSENSLRLERLPSDVESQKGLAHKEGSTVNIRVERDYTVQYGRP